MIQDRTKSSQRENSESKLICVCRYGKRIYIVLKNYITLLPRALANPGWLLSRLHLLALSSLSIYKVKKLICGTAKSLDTISTNDNLLICIYDLEQCPITFNVFEYLAAFNFEAVARKKRFFFVVLDQKIGKNISFGSFAGAYSFESREYRLRNLIAPACALFPACTGYSILYSRDMIDSFLNGYEVFPPSYDSHYLLSNHLDIYDSLQPYVQAGQQFASLTVPAYAFEIANKVVKSSKSMPVITITLRMSKYDEVRNSCLSEWAQFASYARGLGYNVIVIPDSDNPTEYYPIPDQLIYNLFCYNLELRAAIYELAICNLGVANGPMILSTLNRKVNSTLILKVAPSGSETVAMYESLGISPETPSFWCNKNSHNFTINDCFDNIKRVFHDFVPTA